MKKTLFIILLIFIGIFMVKAETIDITSPEINSIILNKTSFKAEDKIKFKIDAYDDISGVLGIVFEFADINNYENSLSIPMRGEFINGEKNYEGIIPLNVRTGEYYLRRVHISDVVHNNSCYAIAGLPFVYEDCVIKDFNIPNIIVEASDILPTPKLESLTYNKTINTGEKLTVTAKITDGAEIENVRIMFNDQQYYLTKIDNNTYSKDILINKKEDLIFDSFTIFDVNNNYINYIYESEYNNLPDNYGFSPFNDGEYDVKVSGETIIKPPVLKNITFSSPTIKVPSYLYAYLDIESEDIDNLDIQIGIHQKDCITNCGAINLANLYKEDGKYYFKLGFDQYQPAGVYYVGNVKITDSYNNEVFYGNWYSEYIKTEPIDYYSFEIVNDTNADITTSNTALDVIDKIKNAKDGSVISIDTSKDSKINIKIFDAIKGTNKIISLESDGIRWIFNGADIKNSKTIDISSKITLARDYSGENWESSNTALIIDFKDNGVLPGKVLIRIKADWTFRDYLGENSLTVYYMNKNKFDLIKDNIVITSDGYYEFYIDHNSTYVLSSKKIDSKLVINDYTEKLDNKSDITTDNNIDDKEEVSENNNDNIINDDKSNNNEQSSESNKDDNKVIENEDGGNDNITLICFSLIISIITLIIAVYLVMRKKIKNNK